MEPNAVESIQDLIMCYAETWAKIPDDYYLEGASVGLIKAYREVTGDKKGYAEYMAMLGKGHR